VNSTGGSLVGTDAKVTQSVPGLLANRIYESRWVSWQALLPAHGVTVDYDAAGQYWTASAPVKVKTLA
jgi:hypothetical protein